MSSAETLFSEGGLSWVEVLQGQSSLTLTLQSGRAFLEKQTETDHFFTQQAPKRRPLKLKHISQQPGRATAQCAIIPDDIFKVLGMENVLHLPRDQ